MSKATINITPDGNWILEENPPLPPDLTALCARVLIAIITCQQNQDRRQSCLDTWIPQLRAQGYTVEFFDGERLGVPDDYGSLRLKTAALCRYALTAGYDFVFKVDDDTYVRADRFLKAGFPACDYAGIRQRANDTGNALRGVPEAPAGTYPHPFAMGAAVWLSRRSMAIITSGAGAEDWAEDRWTGHLLAAAGVPLTPLDDYKACMHDGQGFPLPYLSRNFTVLVDVPSPDEMRRIHIPTPQDRLDDQVHDLIMTIKEVADPQNPSTVEAINLIRRANMFALAAIPRKSSI